jgi:taurine dioxygenase
LAGQQDKTPDVAHPIVRTHRETGRKALFVSPGFTVRIGEVGEAESRELLDILFAHATRPEVQYRHEWRPGQLVACDNRAVMHCATGGYTPPARRTLFRAIVGGVSPV